MFCVEFASGYAYLLVLRLCFSRRRSVLLYGCTGGSVSAKFCYKYTECRKSHSTLNVSQEKGRVK